MRILFGVHQFLPDFFAGTEMLTFNTARELRRRGHEVRVFAGYADAGKKFGPPYFSFYEYEGIPIYRYLYSREDPFISRNVIEASYKNPRSAEGFENAVTSFSPDIVHFYHLQRLSGSVIDVCRQRKIPVVFSATDFWVVCPTHQLSLPGESFCMGPERPPANCLKHLCRVSKSRVLQTMANITPNVFLKTVMRQFVKSGIHIGKMSETISALANRETYLRERFEYVCMVLAATKYMEGVLADWGIPNSKIVHLPFAVPIEPSERQSDKIFSEEIQIGFIGTLYNYKGAHVLLRSLRRIPKTLPITIKIYGDLNQFPAYTDELREIAGNDRRVRFCGIFPPDRIGEVLRDLDILVVPSLWHENAPLVIYESLGRGVPVIASNVSGVKEVIQDGINGFLFERGDDSALAAIMIRFFEDRQLLERLSGNCREVMRFETYVDELETIYAGIRKCKDRTLQPN